MAKNRQPVRLDLDAIEDMTIAIIGADTEIRKSFLTEIDGNNPAEIAAKLSGLARAAASTAQAIMLMMSYERQRVLLEEEMRTRVALSRQEEGNG